MRLFKSLSFGEGFRVRMYLLRLKPDLLYREGVVDLFGIYIGAVCAC